MHPFHTVRNRKLWLLVMLVVGTLLLGAIALTPQGGIVAAQAPN